MKTTKKIQKHQRWFTIMMKTMLAAIVVSIVMMSSCSKSEDFNPNSVLPNNESGSGAANKFINLNVKVFLQGFYVPGTVGMKATLHYLGFSTDATATDTLVVNLWDPDNLSNPTPYHTHTAILHVNGTATFPCDRNRLNNKTLYLSIKHRNHVEIWSSQPVYFPAGGGTVSYDFTNLANVFSNGSYVPMKNMGGGIYAMYGGDVNQDGTVNELDMAAVVIDANNFAFGYNASDCNGDGPTDGSDMGVVGNNTQLMIHKVQPH